MGVVQGRDGVSGCGTREGVGCGTREGVMWVGVVQGRVGVAEGECGYIHIHTLL